MRKFYITFIVTLLSVTAFTSCDEAKESIADWGVTEYYTDFWWKKYTPNIMEQTLEFEYNDDAKKFFTGEVEFELKSKNQDGTFVSTTDYMLLYKNGELCEGNRMKIDVNDTEVVVGVEFKPESPEGCYTLILDPIDYGGLDYIEHIDLVEGFNVQKDDVFNPLAKQTSGVGTTLLAIFVGWLFLSRLVIYRSVRFSKISFDYNDGCGEYMRRVSGCYKIVCTNRKQKVSIFHRIFIGKVYFEVNPFWEQEVTLSNGLRNNIRISTRGDYNLPDESIRKEMFVISNSEKKKVNIETT